MTGSLSWEPVCSGRQQAEPHSSHPDSTWGASDHNWDFWRTFFQGDLEWAGDRWGMSDTTEPHTTAKISLAQAKAGLLREALATVRSLREEYDRACGLTAIAVVRIEARHIDQALATVAEAKTEARHVKYASSKSQLLASIAVAEAKAGRAEESRRTFAEAVAAAKTIGPGGYEPRDPPCLASIAESEFRAGFVTEAAETCRLTADSGEKNLVLAEIHDQEAEAKKGIKIGSPGPTTQNDPTLAQKTIELPGEGGPVRRSTRPGPENRKRARQGRGVLLDRSSLGFGHCGAEGPTAADDRRVGGRLASTGQPRTPRGSLERGYKIRSRFGHDPRGAGHPAREAGSGAGNGWQSHSRQEPLFS